jgi:hypothetical protein
MRAPLNGLSAEISLRPAHQKDIAGILRLLRSCIDDMRRQGIDQWDDVYPTRNRFESDLSSDSLYLAGSEGENIGAMTVNQHQDAEYAGASLSIPAARTLNPRALRLYHGLGYQRAGEVTFRKGSFVCFEKRLA